MSMRLPAKDVETVVLDRVRAFLDSESELFAEYEHGTIHGTLQALVSAAKHLAGNWPRLTGTETRTFISASVIRVIIEENGVEVLVDRDALARYLLGVPPDKVMIDGSGHECETIRLHAETKRQRCGGEVCLLIPAPGAEQKLRPRPVSALIKAVVRAHNWYERLLRGEVSNCEQLAAEIGLGTSYFSRVLRFACLAPDIVDAILQGTQPPHLTFAKMVRNIPLSWAEQRERFGFAPVPQP